MQQAVSQERSENLSGWVPSSALYGSLPFRCRASGPSYVSFEAIGALKKACTSALASPSEPAGYH